MLPCKGRELLGENKGGKKSRGSKEDGILRMKDKVNNHLDIKEKGE